MRGAKLPHPLYYFPKHDVIIYESTTKSPVEKQTFLFDTMNLSIECNIQQFSDTKVVYSAILDKMKTNFECFGIFPLFQLDSQIQTAIGLHPLTPSPTGEGESVTFTCCVFTRK